MSSSTKAVVVLLVLLIVLGVVGVVFMAGILTKLPPGEGGDAPVAAASDEAAGPDASPPSDVRVETGEALARIQARGELVVGMDTGTPPWVGSPPMYFPGPDGEPDGFDYVVAQQIARAAGVDKVKLVHHLYEDFEAALTSGEDVDVIIGGFVPYDAPGIAWSDPYLEFGLCLVVTAESPIRTVKDLEGKIVGVYEDEAAVTEVNRLVKGYGGLERISEGYWDLLVNGEIDAYIYDYPFTPAEIEVWYKQNPHRRGSLRIAQYNLTDSTYAVAMRKQDRDLLAAVNQGIAAFRASDAYTVAVRQYLSSNQVQQAPVAAARTYTVVSGDTLSKIAAAQLGDAGRWTELWSLNRDRFASPNLIEVGDAIILP